MNKKMSLLNTIMYPAINQNKLEIANKLLSLFEDNEVFHPLMWGDTDMLKLEYSRAEILHRLENGLASDIYIYGNKKSKLSAEFDFSFNVRSTFGVSVGKAFPKKNWPDFFDLSDEIARICRPTFGVSHLFWNSNLTWTTEMEKVQHWMDTAADPVPVKFLQNGPLGLGMYTYFDGFVLDMFGRDFLLKAPCLVKELDWGAIRLDLMDKPWDANLGELLSTWMNVMEYLNSSNTLAIPIFSEDNDWIDFRPSENWNLYLKNN